MRSTFFKKLIIVQPFINHIAVYVHNLEASTDFYKNIMGFESIEEPFKIGKHSWFLIGKSTQLHLIKGAQASTEHHINNHLAFSTASVEQFAANLKVSGIKYYDAEKREDVIQVRPDGIKQIFFQDPDGYWLEINDAHTV